MYFYAYIYMCCFIAIYLFYQFTQTPLPAFLQYLHTGISWGFLLIGGYYCIKIVVDCLILYNKSEMSQTHMLNGMLLAFLHYLPTLLIALFMLKAGFQTSH